MKKLLVVTALLSLPSISLADEYVQGYIRRDGTYVEPHYRSSPNRYREDNYSTQGNTNPYTGERGTTDPYGSYQTPRNDPYDHPERTHRYRQPRYTP